MLLLDLDRTLVDMQSFTDYDAAWREVRSLLGERELPRGPETGWASATRACMAAISSLTDGDLWRLVSGAIEVHERIAIEASIAMPGLHEFWAATADRPRGVVTLLPAGVAHDVLVAHGLVDGSGGSTHDVVVIGRDPLIRPKPSGHGLREALRRLAVPTAAWPRAVMVGDSTWDALAARDAGVGFIGVHAPAGEFDALSPAPPAVESLDEVLGLLPG